MEFASADKEHIRSNSGSPMSDHGVLPVHQRRASERQAVLIVEDEAIIAFAMEELVLEAGFDIAGVAGGLEKALALIESGACDVAILDANLAGVSAGPAATALAARGVPFLVLSGYTPDQQASPFSAAAVHLQKPCPPERLIDALRSLASQAQRSLAGLRASD